MRSFVKLYPPNNTEMQKNLNELNKSTAKKLHTVLKIFLTLTFKKQKPTHTSPCSCFIKVYIKFQNKL